MTTISETTRHEFATRLVRNEVIYCVSSLISTLGGRDWYEQTGIDPEALSSLFYCQPGLDEYRESDEINHNGKPCYDVESGDDGFRWTELEPIISEGEPAEKGEWFETELEAWHDLFEDQNLDAPDGREVYEHWIVSDWLADKLAEAGETVAKDIAGLTVWGRATTGQAISMDYVIQSIAAAAYGDDADLAAAAEGETCTACHRASIDCSRDPCAAVIADRGDD